MTLADCLRHVLRLTGTHVGCEHGVCGACTILVDGAAVRACLMLAVQAEGSKVVTIEGLSNDDELTPLQAAFRQASCAAMRLLHAGHDHHGARASERGARLPTPTASARCCPATCAAAPATSRSSRRCSTPAPPTESPRHDAHREGCGVKNTFIGSPVERREDLRFVRGRGEYVDDLAPRWAAPRRDPAQLGGAWAHPRDRRCSRHCGITGVHAVITAKDMPGGPPKIADAAAAAARVQAVRAAGDGRTTSVRYVGEPVAVVLADSVAIGEDALEHIALDIEPLPAVTDCAAAARGDRLLFEGAGTNKSMTFTAACGDADAAFAGAAYVRREKFRTQRHYGLTMEPRGVLAAMGRRGGPAHGLWRGQGAVLQPAHPRRSDRASRGRDRHGRERRRRRLRRPRRILSGGFPHSVRRAPCRTAGEVDRGSPRKSDGDEPCPRGRGGRRDRLRPRRHDPRPARPRRRRHGRLYAHQRRGRRAQHRAVHVGAVPHCQHPTSTSRCG